MAKSTGKIGYGCWLRIGDGSSPEVYTTILEVFDIGPVGETASLVEFTHHQSPNRAREYKHGLIDGEEVSIIANWVTGNASQALVRTAFTGETVDSWQLVTPDSDDVLTFDAIVTHWDGTWPLDDRSQLSFTLKISGPVTIT